MADSAPRPSRPDSRTIEFWWLHDARWYQGVLRRFGQEIANEINSEAMVFVCRRIAAWFTNKHRLDFGRMPMDELVRWFGQIPQLMFTDSMMEAEHTPCGPDVWESTIRKNVALRMLRAAGTLDGYDCSCPVMRAGWFAGMGISVSDSLLECQRTGGEACRFRAVRHNGTES